VDSDRRQGVSLFFAKDERSAGRVAKAVDARERAIVRQSRDVAVEYEANASRGEALSGCFYLG
jgi:hypothetical protein